jgi:uncharacterized protein (TIGR02246 family)
MLARMSPLTPAGPRVRRRTLPLAAALAGALTLILACASGRGAAEYTEATAAATATESCRGSTDLRPLVGVASAPPRAEEEMARAEICVMMDRSARAWNRGDLEAFMEDYVDSATYVGSRGLLRGRTAIGAHYAPRFATGATRDSLSFRGVEVRLVADALAQVVATYVLTRGDSATAMGPTSLLMRRVSGRWRIIHDHSS